MVSASISVSFSEGLNICETFWGVKMTLIFIFPVTRSLYVDPSRLRFVEFGLESEAIGGSVRSVGKTIGFRLYMPPKIPP